MAPPSQSSSDLMTTMFNVDDFSDLNAKGFMRLVNLFLSEAIGTGLMVLLLCGQINTITLNGAQVVDSLNIGIVGGLAVGAAVFCFGHISGTHLNPAISLAAVILGKLSLPLAVLYMIAQCSGSFFAYTLSRAIMPLDLELNSTADAAYGALCCSVPNSKLHPLQVLLTEFLATSILTFAFCSCVDKRNEDKGDSVPIKFAIVLVALIIPISAYSGCSLNPARSLGPALFNNYWKNHWCFWIGPILGSVFSAVVYRFVFDPSYMETKLNSSLVGNVPQPGTGQNELMLGKRTYNCTDDEA